MNLFTFITFILVILVSWQGSLNRTVDTYSIAPETVLTEGSRSATGSADNTAQKSPFLLITEEKSLKNTVQGDPSRSWTQEYLKDILGQQWGNLDLGFVRNAVRDLINWQQMGNQASYAALQRLNRDHKLTPSQWYFLFRAVGTEVEISPDERMTVSSGLPETTISFSQQKGIDMEVVVQKELNNQYPSRNHWVEAGKLTEFGEFREQRKKPLRNFQIGYELVHPEKEVITAIGSGNILSNSWFVAYVDGEFIHTKNEPWEKRIYSSLVVWKDQGISMEEVRFEERNGGFRIKVQERDITEKVHSLVFAQRLIDGGENVPIENIASQFEDVRHLLLLPSIRPPDRARYYFGLEQLSEHPTLVQKAIKGPIELEIQQDDITYDKLKKSLQSTKPEPYREVSDDRELKQGEYRQFNEGDKTITIWLYDGIYPHNFIGIKKDRTVVALQVRGASSREGVSLREAQIRGRELGLQNMGLLDNGGDVMMLLGDGFIVPSSEFRTKLSAAILFVRNREEGRGLSEEQIHDMLREYVMGMELSEVLKGHLLEKVANPKFRTSQNDRIQLIEYLDRLISNPGLRQSLEEDRIVATDL